MPPWIIMRCTALTRPFVSPVTVAVLPESATAALPVPVTRFNGTACIVAAKRFAACGAVEVAVDELLEPSAMTAAIAPAAITSPATRGHQ